MNILLTAGLFFIVWGFLCFYYFRKKELKPFFLVISQKTIDNYKEKRQFSEKQIFTAVQIQGTFLFIIGVALILIVILKKILFQ